LEPYKILDHEADVGFEVYGYTEEELFQNATFALFSLITDLGAIRLETERRVEITGNGESLIVFLNELLYLWDVERFISKVIGIVREGVNIKAILRGELFDEHRHTMAGAVKAVTYHKFSVRKEQEMLKATFIVDI
jgi:SHS2 domain-containing protein